jgi:hypothetical protein
MGTPCEHERRRAAARRQHRRLAPRRAVHRPRHRDDGTPRRGVGLIPAYVVFRGFVPLTEALDEPAPVSRSI